MDESEVEAHRVGLCEVLWNLVHSGDLKVPNTVAELRKALYDVLDSSDSAGSHRIHQLFRDFRPFDAVAHLSKHLESAELFMDETLEELLLVDWRSFSLGDIEAWCASAATKIGIQPIRLLTWSIIFLGASSTGLTIDEDEHASDEDEFQYSQEHETIEDELRRLAVINRVRKFIHSLVSTRGLRPQNPGSYGIFKTTNSLRSN